MSERAPRPEAKTSVVPGSSVPPPLPPKEADATNWIRPPNVPPPGPDAPAATRPLGGKSTPVPAPEYLPRVNGYELLEELGRGGMGVVYKAWQHSLQRTVALKMILSGAFATESDIERFRTEAVSVAKLRHPFLLNIYEIGYQDGLPFFSMEYLDGGSLTQYLNGRPQPSRTCALLLQKLAQAMDYAHQKGVIHRDLKPANILFLQVEPDTAPPPPDASTEAARTRASGSSPAILSLEYLIPKITDFGLAKQIHQDHFLTRTGDILGTPAYMAPEQAGGRNELVGPRTDIYSLGAILYELISGAPLFQDASPAETILKVTQEEPTPPRKLNRSIPADLETICLKCLEKDPQKRYATAGELAADLGRFLAGEPIVARKPSLTTRALKWVKRHPAKTVAGITSVLILALAFGWIATSLRNAQLEAETQKLEAEAQRIASSERAKALQEAERLLGEALLDRGLFMAERGDEARGLHWMLRSLEILTALEGKLGRDLSFSSSIRRSLASWTHQYIPREATLNHDGGVWTVAFSRPDGKFALTGGVDGIVRIWDATTGKLMDKLVHTFPVWGLGLEPTGRFLFTLCGDAKQGNLQVFELVGGDPLYRRKGDIVKFSVSAVPHPVLDKKTGKIVGFHVAGASSPPQVRLDKTGKRLLLLPSTNQAFLFQFDPDAEGHGLTLLNDKIAHPAGILSASFNPEGKEFYTGSIDGTFTSWDAHTGGKLPRQHAPLPGRIAALVPSQDGRVLVIGCSRRHPGEPGLAGGVAFAEVFGREEDKGAAYDGMVLLYDLQEARPLIPPIPLPHRVKSLALSRDSEVLAAGCYQMSEDRKTVLFGEVRFLHTRGRHAGKEAGKTIPHPSNIWDMKISPDGQFLLTGCEDRQARLFTLADQMPVGQPIAHEGNVVQVAFHPRGTSVLTASGMGKEPAGARLWDVPVPLTWGKPLSHFDMDEAGQRVVRPVSSVLWESDGTHAWTATHAGAVRRWHVPTGKAVEVFLLDGGKQPLEIALIDRGRALLIHGQDGSVTRYEMGTGRRTLLHGKVKSDPTGLCLVEPDGESFLILTPADGRVQRFSARGGEPLGKELVVDPNVNVAAISPDGRLLATAVYEPHALRSTVLVRNLASGEVRQKWEFPNRIFTLGFTPKNDALVSGGEDRLVQVWNLKTGKLQAPPLMHDHPVISLAFSPDGQVLATTCLNGPTRMWDVASSRPLGKPLLKDRTVRKPAFRPDGKLLLVGSESDGEAYLFLVPFAMEAKLAHVRLWIEVLTGMEMTSNDAIVPLSFDTLAERRLQLHLAGGSPYRPRLAD